MTNLFTNGYALLIGVDENSVAKWALPDVIKDIGAISTVLTHPERCAYLTGNVKTITGQDATRQGILDGLAWLQGRIQADASGNATVVIYYSGHGWVDEMIQPNEYFFIPYDVREIALKSRALRATDFSDAVSDLNPQRLLVVLDCCHAGGMGIKDVLPLPQGYVGAAFSPAVLMKGEKTIAGPGAKGLEALAQGAGRAVLSSSQGTQSSWIRSDKRMSIFTYHLIEALTGHAQPQEGAKEVLVSDVMSHVYRRVPASAKAEHSADQQPDFQISGNFPIALLLGGKGLSKGQPAPDPLAPIAAGSTISVGGDYAGRDQITTGGDYVGGDKVTTSGDYIGRDKVVYGDEVHGDKVGGDKISVGNISGSTGIAIGRGAQATVRHGLGSDDITKVFAVLAQKVAALPEGPGKVMAQSAVQGLEAESHKGDQAKESDVNQWFAFLAQAAPDIWEVAVNTFINPISGLSTVFQKIAQRAKEERRAR